MLSPLVSSGGGSEYTRVDSIGGTTPFSLSTSVADNTFESLGPTGSGMDNIWAAMDLLPANSTYMDVLIIYVYGNSSTGVLSWMQLTAFPEGTVGGLGVLWDESDYLANITGERTQTFLRIPINPDNNSCDIWYRNRNAISLFQLTMYYFGGGN